MHYYYYYYYYYYYVQGLLRTYHAWNFTLNLPTYCHTHASVEQAGAIVQIITFVIYVKANTMILMFSAWLVICQTTLNSVSNPQKLLGMKWHNFCRLPDSPQIQYNYTNSSNCSKVGVGLSMSIKLMINTHQTSETTCSRFDDSQHVRILRMQKCYNKYYHCIFFFQ